jgi:AAA domain
MIRVRAGISYALSEAMDEGHCGLPVGELVSLAEKLLEVPQDLISTALGFELADGTVVADRVGETDCVFLASLYRPERAIAERLLKLAAGKLPWPPIDADKAIPWIEQRIGLTLAESQKVAVRLALAFKVLVITGGPGVGKTTIVNSISRMLAAKGVSRTAGNLLRRLMVVRYSPREPPWSTTRAFRWLFLQGVDSDFIDLARHRADALAQRSEFWQVLTGHATQFQLSLLEVASSMRERTR